MIGSLHWCKPRPSRGCIYIKMSDAQMQAEIARIVRSQSLELLSIRMVRTTLETKFACDLSDRKDWVKTTTAVHCLA